MRKAQHQEILDMLQTLDEAHKEIKENIEKGNVPDALGLLTQCQECAIMVGTTIEKLEGEGFVTVSYVEAYCDAVYKSHEEINVSGQSINANKIYKNLRKQLLRIESSVKNDITIRKEIAFFPYKASMWDSLESVYLAAKEDPNCDAYCVPIPYYDRNPDKSFGQMHYEGREYPKNIEVIDYRTYNFEERKPDVIYIHNPYDDWNLVTCVHPRYFSKNLKQYTEQLVYIPYFVLDEIEPNDQARIDSMKHFVSTPGVINADKVIVQSENMRQIYINEYIKFARENNFPPHHMDRKYLEQKILGTGSPKFDKVQNTKKEDLEIPESWLKIIEKPDGSWKKIIFYNTSIAALLENREKMLEKMKDVFRVFKENKDEVALLWRPHPLIKSTVSAMLPQLWVEYEKLVNQYKQEGWGIYDDTSDMDRAVVLSDAYYGDASSVVSLFEILRKPILMANVNVVNSHINNANTISLNYRGYIRKESNIVFLNYMFNGIFKIDLLSGKIEYLGSLRCEKPAKEYLVGLGMICSQNNIYLFLNSDNNKIVKINLLSDEQKEIIAICGKEKNLAKSTWQIFLNEKIYILPLDLSVGIYYLETYDDSVHKDNELSLKVNNLHISTNVVSCQNKIYFGDNQNQNIVCIDCTKKEIETYSLPFRHILMHGIEVFEERVWITQVDSSDVYCWDLCSNKYNIYLLKNIEYIKNNSPYMYPKYVGKSNMLVLTGNDLRKVFYIDDLHSDIEILFEYQEYLSKLENCIDNKPRLSEAEIVQDELWFHPNSGNMILIFDLERKTLRHMELTQEKTKILNYKTIMEDSIYKEIKNENQEYLTLQIQLDYIMEKGKIY